MDDEEALHGLRTECLRAGSLVNPFPDTTDWRGPGTGGEADCSVAGTLVLSEIGCGPLSRLVIMGTGAGQVWLDDRSWGGLTSGPDFLDWCSAWLASQWISNTVLEILMHI
ncbi:hypothetical protein ACIQJT_35370 [Streptomyces sp. NPDC091972]|uniref:hypothetical protein n=1 Tax=Streptomyces sp. NPDC091972 TaxID=3366007 RepID=UPI00382EA8AE